jgi:hypothetical protein
MDLFCPHCSQRVSVPNEKAGQVTSCPLCTKQFMTPALAPPPVTSAPPPPPPTTESYGMGPPPTPPVVDVTAGTQRPSPPPRAPESPPPPPPPPGDYTRTFNARLTGDWLAFVPTACVVVIFLLSFFSWHYVEQKGYSLWGLSFLPEGAAQFLGYTILMFPCGLFAIVAMVLEKGWLKLPPQFAPVLAWKNALVGLFLLLAFLMLCIDYLIQHFTPEKGNPITIWEKFAIRLHLLAMIATFVMLWLNLRKTKNLPAPTMEVRT